MLYLYLVKYEHFPWIFSGNNTPDILLDFFSLSRNFHLFYTTWKTYVLLLINDASRMHGAIAVVNVAAISIQKQ